MSSLALFLNQEFTPSLIRFSYWTKLFKENPQTHGYPLPP